MLTFVKCRKDTNMYNFGNLRKINKKQIVDFSFYYVHNYTCGLKV